MFNGNDIITSRGRRNLIPRIFSYGAKQFGYWFGTPQNRGQFLNQAVLGGLIPQYGNLLQARDNIRKMDDTMRLYNLNWSDIRYSSHTIGWSGGRSLGSGISQVSKNIERLYG